jgi:SAM-dependent methyltransferase
MSKQMIALKTILKQWLMHSYLHPRYLAARELHKIIALEAPKLSGYVLDVGCGQKPYRRYLRPDVMHIGLDVPTSMHGMDAIDTLGTAHHLPFQDAVFDGCLCSEVLEHTSTPLQVLSEMARVTKTGGTLLLTVPFSEQLHEIPHDYYRFTEYALQSLMASTGWTLQRVYCRGSAWLELTYRLSSLLYSAVGATRDEIGQHHPKLILGPVIVIICMLIQMIGSMLDKRWPISLSTIGYGIVAVKQPLSSGSE